MNSTRKKLLVTIGLLFLFTLLITLPRFKGDYPLGWDAGEYMVHSKSLSMGNGYRDIAEPNSHKLFVTPTGYPYFLALLWLITNENIFVMNLFNWIIVCLIPIFIFLWLRRFLLHWESLLLSLSFASHYMFIETSQTFLSEGLFMVMLYGGLALGSLFFTRGSGSLGWFYLSQIRSVGMAFLFVHLLELIKTKKFKIFAGILVLWILWIGIEKLWVFPPSDTGTHAGNLSKIYPISEPLTAIYNLWKNITRNLWAIAGSLYAKTIFPESYHWFTMNQFKRVLVLGVFFWSILGGIIAWKRNREFRPLLLGFLLSMLPVLIWVRVDPLSRYIFPFLPIYLVLFYLPIKEFTANINSSVKKRIILSIFFVFLLGNQMLYSQKHNYSYLNIPGKSEFQLALKYISNSAQKPDILLSPKKFYTYLYTGVHSTQFEYGHNMMFNSYSSGENKIWALIGPTNNFLLDAYSEDDKVLKRKKIKSFGKWSLFEIYGVYELKSPD